MIYNPNLLTLYTLQKSFTMTGYHGIESRVDADEAWSESFMLCPEKPKKIWWHIHVVYRDIGS